VWSWLFRLVRAWILSEPLLDGFALGEERGFVQGAVDEGFDG